MMMVVTMAVTVLIRWQTTDDHSVSEWVRGKTMMEKFKLCFNQVHYIVYYWHYELSISFALIHALLFLWIFLSSDSRLFKYKRTYVNRCLYISNHIVSYRIDFFSFLLSLWHTHTHTHNPYISWFKYTRCAIRFPSNACHDFEVDSRPAIRTRLYVSLFVETTTVKFSLKHKMWNLKYLFLPFLFTSNP